MEILTAGVLMFQAIIFISIMVAAGAGVGWLRVVTCCWVAFTLFGSIYTLGLLLLQLITIMFAYKAGKRKIARLHA